MKFVILLAVVVAYVHGANKLCWTVDQIAAEVFSQTDTNGDGILELDELNQELLINWNLSNDSCLNYHDFTSNWIANYHDHHDTAHAFFNNLDLDGDHQLCLIDVAVQIVTFDKNPTDGMIEPAEMTAFMHAVHPDSHQNSAHGNGC